MPDESKSSPNESQLAGVTTPLTQEEVDYTNVVKRTFYANHGQAVSSLFEMRLVFNYVDGVDLGTNKLIGRENLTVVMSPEMGMLICRALATNLQQYVEKFGPLRLSGLHPPQPLEPSPDPPMEEPGH
jgi:hypothetical protein